MRSNKRLNPLLKKLITYSTAMIIGGCSLYSSRDFSDRLFTENSQNLEELLILERELESRRIDAIQKITNNVVQIEVLAKRKQIFLTKDNLSKQIKERVLKRINSIYDGDKTERIIESILSNTLKNINLQIAFSNVKGDFKLAGTGFIYKTCRGDVLLTSHHLLSPSKYFYSTPYGGVLVETKLRSKEVFYNGREINLEKLIVLNEPDIDLIITRLPDYFDKKTYPIKLARKDELRSGKKVIKMGNTFGEGIQISSGVVSYNETREKIILGRKIDIRLLSLPVAAGDSGSPTFLEENLKFVGNVIGSDSSKDNLSVPMRAYILPWEQSIGKLKEIKPYDECFYN